MRGAKRVVGKVRAVVSERAFRLVVRTSARDDLVRIGSVYGGSWVPTSLLDEGSVVYSAGLGEDATFDLGLAERFGCHVWSLDPTPRSIAYAQTIDDPRFHFLPVGLWSEPASLRFYAPADDAHVSHSILNLQKTSDYFDADCWPLPKLMEDQGHHRLDLLKMNIEGAEGAVLDGLSSWPVQPVVLVVSFEEPTWRARVSRVRALRQQGYRPVRVDGGKVTLIRMD